MLSTTLVKLSSGVESYGIFRNGILQPHWGNRELVRQLELANHLGGDPTSKKTWTRYPDIKQAGSNAAQVSNDSMATDNGRATSPSDKGYPVPRSKASIIHARNKALLLCNDYTITKSG